MNKNILIKKQNTLLVFIVCSALGLFSSTTIQASEGEHGKEEAHKDERVFMADSMAQKMGVMTQSVQTGSLNITTTVYGNIVTDPASLSHVRARFDGMVTKVNANLGNKVKKGETLAVVESNESLKSYPVAAPFSGTVIARHANEGELSNGQVLFSIANYDDVWAQLKIFPQQLSDIAEQQPAQLSLSGAALDTTIQHILPSPDEKPYVLAYAKIGNTSGQWPVGAAINDEKSARLRAVRWPRVGARRQATRHRGRGLGDEGRRTPPLQGSVGPHSPRRREDCDRRPNVRRN